MRDGVTGPGGGTDRRWSRHRGVPARSKTRRCALHHQDTQAEASGGAGVIHPLPTGSV
jgi:hypothetical protein